MRKIVISILFSSMLLAVSTNVVAQDNRTTTSKESTKEDGNKEPKKCKKDPLTRKCDSGNKK